MVQKMKALLVLGAFAAVTSTAHAQIAATAKCETAKVKCVINKAGALLKCQGNAAKKGLAVDTVCVAKAVSKFGTVGTGCMAKAEAKPPCLTTGDTTAIENKVDAMVSTLVTQQYVNPAPTAANACWAAQQKCVAGYIKANLGCESKAVQKGVPTDTLCLAKAVTKFTNGGSPSGTGCMDKLTATGKACTTSGIGSTVNTNSVLASTNAFDRDVRAELMPNNKLVIVNQPGVGNCGEVDSASGAVLILPCGDLAVGGGASGIPPYPVPSGTTTKFSLLGTSGASRQLVGAPSTISGTSRNCSRAGCKFGSPVPVQNGPLSTCLDNSFVGTASGTVNITAGTVLADIPLQTVVTVTGNSGQPCPLCVAGSCTPDAVNGGASCTADSTNGQSHDCIAAGPVLSPFSVDLAGTTTGVASASNPSGLFCPGQNNAGAFGNPTGITITENGVAGGDLTVGPAVPATLASVFCIPATGNLLIDGSADLPGPGAVTLPVTEDLQ
jgi:hypothetical protein